MVAAAEEPLICAGLERLLAAGDGVLLVGTTCDVGEVVRLCRGLRPHVLLLDPSLPGLTQLDVVGELAGQARPPAILLLAAGLSPLATRALRLGVRGLLLKRAQPSELVEAIRAVAAGMPWLGRDLTAMLLDQVPGGVDGSQGADPLERLTPREREVVAAAGTGAPNREIAERLALSEQTVKHHLTRAFAKLKVRSRAQLVARLAAARAADPGGRGH